MKKIKLISVMLAFALTLPLVLISCDTPDIVSNGFLEIPETFGSPYPTNISGSLIPLSVMTEYSTTPKPVQEHGHCPIYVINDQKQFDDFADKFADAMYDNPKVPYFKFHNLSREEIRNIFTEKYGNVDFEKDALIFCVFGSPSGSYRYSVSHIDIEDNKFVINIAQHEPGFSYAHTNDYAELQITMTVPQKDIENITHFDAQRYATRGIYVLESDSKSPSYIMVFDDYTFLMHMSDGRRIWGSCEYGEGDKIIFIDNNTAKKYIFESDNSNNLIFSAKGSAKRLLDNGACFSYENKQQFPAAYFNNVDLEIPIK